MNNKEQNTILSLSKILSVLVALFFVLQTPAVLASDPPENVRAEDGLLRWDSVDGAISYNIYALPLPVNGNGFYVTTVTDETEFQPTFRAFYSVVAFFGGSPAVFSDITAVDLVEVGEGPLLSGQQIRELLDFGIPVRRISEIRTNRCTNLSAGQSCTATCDASSNSIASGGACRADAAIVLHQQAVNGGYMCLATADTAYVEADAVCLFPDNF